MDELLIDQLAKLGISVDCESPLELSFENGEEGACSGPFAEFFIECFENDLVHW